MRNKNQALHTLRKQAISCRTMRKELKLPGIDSKRLRRGAPGAFGQSAINRKRG